MLEHIRQLRKEHKLTQTDFAKILNISREALSSYETGKREPDLELLKAMASYFNVSTDYILGLTAIRQRIDNVLISNIKNNLNDILNHKCDIEKYLQIKAEISSSLDEIYLNKNKNC